MYASGEYTRVDPKEAKILALTTRLESLEKSATPNSAHATTGDGGTTTTKGGGDNISENNPTGKMSGNVATWHTINVGPTSTAPDGTTVHWCPHHVHPHGLFNGTYGWHEPKITMLGRPDCWQEGEEKRLQQIRRTQLRQLLSKDRRNSRFPIVSRKCCVAN